MKQFNLLTQTFDTPEPSQKKRSVSTAKRFGPPGCKGCPLENVLGLRKVKGLVRIKQRKAMLWAQSPGGQENLKGLELIGPVGKFLWETTELHGWGRKDVDIQNVLRCRPADYRDGEHLEHPPTKEELHHCAIYNQRALELNAGAAKVHLILGKVAGAQLLGKDYRKDTPVLWYAPWNAYVVLADHPSYIVRCGGRKSGWLWNEFQLRMRAVRALMDYPGRWSYVFSQGYRAIYDPVKAQRWLKRAQDTGLHVSVDIEDGVVDGKRAMLIVSFACGYYRDKEDWQSWEGSARSFILDHPENTASSKTKAEMVEVIREFLGSNTPKVMQYGSSDAKGFKEILGIDKIRGYDTDSMYEAYLRYSYKRKYGLDSMARNFYPEFADYKDMMLPYHGDWAKAPLSTMVPYGCADADLTARIHATCYSKKKAPLLKVYTRAAFTIDKMDNRGPILDKQALDEVDAVIPKQVEALTTRLRQAAGNPDFNPGNAQQVAWLLFDKLGLPTVDEKNPRSTGKEVLQTLTSIAKSPIPQTVLDLRYLAKAKSTYINGFRRSADLNNGELRTRWHLTGATTGRLRSGGDEDASDGIMNFQNFHGNPLLQIPLVSDLNWRWAIENTEEYNLDDLYVYLSLDYSQIEIRMLAEVTQDPLLIKQFNSGLDIHCQVGHELTGWDVDKIAKDKETRRLVKNLHFGIVYGISEKGAYDFMLAKGMTKVSRSKVVKLHRKYFERYSRVAEWIEECRAWVEKHGYIENIFGFQREMGGWDPSRSTYWGNQAINCVDYETEALTDRGWLCGPEIKLTDKLLTKNAVSGALEWQHPTAIKLFPDYKGPVHKFESRAFSAVTTPDHRWLINDKEGRARCWLSKEFAGWGDEKVHRTGEYFGVKGNTFTDDEIRLIGWVLTDGFYKKGYGYTARTGVGVCQSLRGNPKKVKIIDRLFSRLTKLFKVNRSVSKQQEVFWVFFGPFSRRIREMFPQRELTPEFLACLSRRQAELLYEAMFLADGSTHAKWGESFAARNTNRADMFQMLCVLCGKATSTHERDFSGYTPKKYASMPNIPRAGKSWGVHVHRRDFAQVVASQITKTTDKVSMWCPMVPNTYFVVRRRGQVYITGNTPIQGAAHTLLLIAMAILAVKPKTYRLLQDLTAEVHDALVFRVKLRDLGKAYQKAMHLMQVEIPAYIESEFGRKLSVPILAEGSAGFNLGTLADYNGQPETEFLKQWREKYQSQRKAGWEKLTAKSLAI